MKSRIRQLQRRLHTDPDFERERAELDEVAERLEVDVGFLNEAIAASHAEIERDELEARERTKREDPELYERVLRSRQARDPRYAGQDGR